MLRLCDPLSQVSVFSISSAVALRDCGAGAPPALVRRAVDAVQRRRSSAGTRSGWPPSPPNMPVFNSLKNVTGELL